MTAHWRRKPDGRPYIDLGPQPNGKRPRFSMLTDAERAAGPPWPDNAECQRRFDAFIAGPAAAMLDGAMPVSGKRKRQITALADLQTYCLEILCADMAQGSRDMARWSLATALETLAKDGVRTVADINAFPGCVEAMKHRLATRYKPKSIDAVLYWLRFALRRAEEAGRIPAVAIKRWPRVKLREPQFKPMPGADAIRRYWAAVSSAEDKDALMFLWLTGMRPSDLCRLRWESVGPESLLIAQQKTGGTVSIHLAPAALDILRRSRLRRQGRPLVFYSPFGRPYTPKRLWAASVKASEAAGIERITPKMGRQFVVTHLLDSGFAPQSIGAMTGHRSREYEKYHLLRSGSREDMAAKVADALENTLSPRNLSPPVTFPAKSLLEND